MDSDDEEMICSICNKPILEGQARYTAGEHKGIFRHYECYEPTLKKHDALIANLDRDIERILGPKTARKSQRKRPCRPGDGPVAKRLAPRIVEAVKRDLGLVVEPEDLDFWVQDPAHRGPRWDLACWGCHFVHPEMTNLKIGIHSWKTMTGLLKQKTLSLSPDGPWSFDIG